MAFDFPQHTEILLPVGSGSSSNVPHMSAPRWDWYGATVPDATTDDLIQLAVIAGDGIRVGANRPSELKGGHYKRWVTLWDRSGPCAQVHWQHRTSPDPRIDVWGPQSHALASALRASYRHFTTRADSSCDTEDMGAFLALKGFLVTFIGKYPYPVVTDDRTRTKGEAKARTFYIGAEESEVRLCVYEKGQMKGFEDRPGLVRVELRVCPDSSDDQLRLSTMTPEEVWGFARWSMLLAPEILCTHVPRCAQSTVHGKTTVQQKAESCARSYGPHLPYFFENCGGPEHLGDWLLSIYERQRSNAITNRGGKKRERARGRDVRKDH